MAPGGDHGRKSRSGLGRVGQMRECAWRQALTGEMKTSFPSSWLGLEHLVQLGALVSRAQP